MKEYNGSLTPEERTDLAFQNTICFARRLRVLNSAYIERVTKKIDTATRFNGLLDVYIEKMQIGESKPWFREMSKAVLKFALTEEEEDDSFWEIIEGVVEAAGREE